MTRATTPGAVGYLVVPVAVPHIPRRELEPPDDLWGQLRTQFALDHHRGNPRVVKEIERLKRHPRYLEMIGERAGRYLPLIAHRVELAGLPGELALVPVVESALDPYAISPGGAGGLWQFMPATARHYGLDMNFWVDARRDPIAATDAALRYLTRLETRFDDWLLALAAYNAGGGRVSWAIDRHGTPDTAHFWNLDLPRETDRYVPRLLALAAVIATPREYGLTLPAVPAESDLAIVELADQLDLAVAAATIGVEIEDIYRFNPQLRQWATPPEGPHHLLLERRHADEAAAALAALPADERMRWRRHVVRSGDTLIDIAHEHHTTVAAIRRANGLSGSRIIAGDALLVPKPGIDPDAISPVPARPEIARQFRYRVRQGDSLWLLARQFDVSIMRIVRTNQLDPNAPLSIGQTLYIPGQARSVSYRVRAGDSLSAIAQRFDIRVADIVSWNRIDPDDLLHPGQRLTLLIDV